jgi:putative ABC transport system permease protein
MDGARSRDVGPLRMNKIQISRPVVSNGLARDDTLLHRVRRTSLTGMRGDTTLRRLVDRDQRVMQVPVDGLALSATLADLLDVTVGDIVRVEILEGQRRKVAVQVTRLVDEYVGTSSYMDAVALERLLREAGSVSGAHLLVDTNQQDELNQVLKSTPEIAGVSSRQAMIQSFEDTIKQSMLVSTLFIVVFACVIAVGVVYNGARIALSERGRELASLRVLGFSRGEVAWMLLGEQGLLTLLAVPVGSTIGYLLCAVIAGAFSTELYRFPLVLTQKTYAFAFGVILLAAIFSGLIVYRRIRSLDLVAVLKTRE